MSKKRLRLAIRDLIVKFKGFTLGPINASFNVGLNLIIGPNGAGKTTLLRSILGLLRLDEGEVFLEQNGLRTSVRGLAAYLPQEISLDEAITVRSFIAYFTDLFGLKDSIVKRNVRIFGLDKYFDSKVFELSGGLRKRLVLTIILSHERPVVILDEPFVGLDNEAVTILVGILERMSTNRILLVSSHTHELLYTLLKPSSILVLHKGRQLFHGGNREMLRIASNCGYYALRQESESHTDDRCITYSICGMPRMACLKVDRSYTTPLDPNTLTIFDYYNCLLLLDRLGVLEAFEA